MTLYRAVQSEMTRAAGLKSDWRKSN